MEGMWRIEACSMLGSWIGCPRHINPLFADYICVKAILYDIFVVL